MSWFEGFHPDQSNWPYERIRGWGPGDYTCTCQDCGCHYMGAKRSVQCYPCAEKFVPPPRSETPEEIRTDRDSLRSDLERTREDLEMVRSAGLRLLAVVEDYHAYEHSGDPYEEDARQHREMDIDELRGTPIVEIRAALERKEGGAK